MDPLIQDMQQRGSKVLDVIHTDLSTIRTGRAAPSIVENIVISAYAGSARLKIMELATVHASDPQTLVITPFDPSIIGEIKKGLEEANTGLTPTIDSAVIRISIPPLSQERREELIHLMKQKLENGRILVRQARQDAMTDIKKDEEMSEDEKSRLEKEVQKITDDFMTKIDAMGKQKEEELMQI